MRLMKAILSALLILFTLTICLSQDLPSNPKSGKCYIGCPTDSREKIWLNSPCVLLKSSFNEIKYIQERLKKKGYPIDMNGALSYEFIEAVMFDTRIKKSPKAKQLARFKRKLVKNQDKASCLITVKHSCKFEGDDTPYFYGVDLQKILDSGRLQEIQEALIERDYDIEATGKLNAETIMAFNDFSYKKFKKTFKKQ